MADRVFGITKFVRGMAWHDVGKPFALGTPKHAALGYWLLVRAGYPDEALVALAHGGKKWSGSLKKALEPYFRQHGAPLPGFLLMGNALDRISASFYSLLGRKLNPREFEHYHTWHNPFSRLPVVSDTLQSPFIAFEQVDEQLREALIEALPDSWGQHIQRDDLDEAVQFETALQAEPAPTDGRALIHTLERFMSQYPERTYPPANDTALLEHNRLSGALAFVLYRNLEHQSSAWLSQHIRYADDGKYYLQIGNKEREVYTYLFTGKGDEDLNWNGARRAACEHLDARLVRVAFEGHRDLFEHAVRVDDLLGVRVLTQRFLDAFEEALAQELGTPGLVWPSERDARRCLLTLNRDQFDLFYLLPPNPDPAGELTIEEVVDRAYDQALDFVVSGLTQELERDFVRAVRAGRLDFGEKETQALRQQLRGLGYRIQVLDPGAPAVADTSTFAEFTHEYGVGLIEQFRAAQSFAVVPPGDLPFPPGTLSQTLASDEVCDVCGDHPFFAPFAALLEDEEWKTYVQKAVHHFRDEPERPCISCIARRILSHGAVAQETEHVLRKMVDLKKAGDGQARLVAVPPESGLDLPPGMVASVTLDGYDDRADIGAAFARYRRDGGVDLFPTISYAADRMGNVVMLTLQPTKRIFEEYTYAKAATFGGPPDEIAKGERPPETDLERWLASFGLVYEWIVEQRKNEEDEEKKQHWQELADNMVRSRPHLARVLERIRHVQTFYRTLKDALEAKPLRVLPLDVDFPTLRLLVPAGQLDAALEVLNQVVTTSLFSATFEGGPDYELLAELVPDLLHGAIILFKQKFPLYLALEAERDLFHQLAIQNNAVWYGLRLGFTDLRGSLSEVGHKHAEVTYVNLCEVLDLARAVDRRTVLLRARTAQHITPELADALTVIRADHVSISQEQATKLQEEAIFKPVLFLTKATRG